MSLSEGELYAAHARSSERCRCGHPWAAHNSEPPFNCWVAFVGWVARVRGTEHCPCRAFDALLPGELAEEWGK